jgi:proline iminopeptidase
MPHAELRIIPDAGHSMAEPGITDALIDATNRFAGIGSS